ncbi:hypothetical protein HOLleu_09350 [Holothuria leucospilota]|uniref:Uncharacterized protein n=1 Tax=Holothuria leucospilota TaxID=206669 RepID=A0A9Q1HEW0_HOLLE|nr:hypothetical protein HOLleu_09350 [Holothuria leucospilota]
MNLSDHTLFKYEEDVLQHSLTFCPSRKLDPVGVCQDLSEFIRRVRLKENFKDEEQQTARTPPQKSNWTPSGGRNSFIDKFAMTAKSHLDRFLSQQLKQKMPANLPVLQKEAMKNLRANGNIVIRPADKGGATTILNTDDYIKEAEQQLGNRYFYTELSEDSYPSFQGKADDLYQILSKDGATLVKALIPGSCYLEGGLTESLIYANTLRSTKYRGDY